MIIRMFGRILPLCCVLMGVAAAQEIDLTGQRVARVELEGLERASDQLVRSQLEIKPGETFNPRAVARDIRRLYDLGFFSRIEADADTGPDGLVVTYIFEEKRVIEEIKIIGNDRVRERHIRGAISWREGDSFVPDAYNDERESIIELYQSKGFPNASVDIIVEEIGPGRVRITYSINEGKKARIAEIAFEGNDVLSDRQLRRLMETKRKWWFLGGKYDEAVFENDLQSILDEYGNYGRLEANIEGTEFTYSESGKNVDVTIYVEEGPEYSVGTMEIADNVVFDDDEILNIIEVQPGQIHNRGQVEEDATTIEKGYIDSGYIFAEVAPQVTLDRENKTTTVVYLINERTMKYVREIKITGNSITRDEVIRRNLLLIPGDRFDGSSIRYSQQLLDNLNYFDEIRMTREIIEDDDRFANLLVDVSESKTGEFGFGASFATDEGIGGFAEIEFNNFDISNWPTFTGGGQNLRARLSIGDRREEYYLAFTDPEIGGYPLSFGFDIFNESTEYDGSNFDESQAGGQLRFGKILSPFVRTQVTARYVDTDISDVPVFAVRELRRLWNDDGTTASLSWGITRNTLNNRRDPSSGGRYSFEIEVAGFGSDHDFYKLEHDSIRYWALDEEEKWILSYRARHGWVEEYGDSDFVSLSDRFYAGGTSTVRGYDSRDIGPSIRRFGFFGEKYRVGGKIRVVNNLELKYKLTEQVRFYTFVDGGGVWADTSDFSLSDMRYSVGIGFGVEVPRLGPIRIDYGFPINPDEDQGSGRLHLLTGFRF